MRMLGVSKKNNKYGCMLLASLGNAKGMFTRASAQLHPLSSASPNRPTQPNPAYDLPKEATSFVIWMTQGDTEFWNKAQSSSHESSILGKAPMCMSRAVPAGNSRWVDASKPTSDGILWGCPTAIPKGSPGNYTWETSTSGRYATKTVETLKPPRCVMRAEFEMSLCDTCCCKVHSENVHSQVLLQV